MNICVLFEFIPNFTLNSILGNDLYEADKVTFQEVRVKKQDTLRDVLKLFAVQTGHATERLVSNCNHIPPRTPRISRLKSQILKTTFLS